MKFKVGDKIRGISDSYIITDKNMSLGEVVHVNQFGIEIKIIEHSDSSLVGKVCFAALPKGQFELVEEKKMDKLEELETKIKELSEEIERLKEEKENETGKLEHGDVYWFVNHIGEIKLATWYGDPEDETRYELGNVFIKRWEASFKVEQLKVEAELRRFGRKFVENSRNYCLRYTHNSKVIYIEYFSSIQDGGIYFDTADIARKAIDTVGEERIKKYYFGINE